MLSVATDTVVMVKPRPRPRLWQSWSWSWSCTPSLGLAARLLQYLKKNVFPICSL